MKKKYIRLVPIAVLALVLAVSVIQLVRIQVGYRSGEDTYAEAAALAGLPDWSELSVLPEQSELSEPSAFPPQTPAPAIQTEPSEDVPDTPEPSPSMYIDPYADALQNADFTALREVNGDVLGWILIPNTVVSYPFVQGEDNDYYIDHTWRKTYNSVGAIFMECTNSGDFSDFNTILYGHRMNNKSMFGVLHRFADQSYWADHPYVYITDDNGSRQYEIFAAYEVSTTGTTYRLRFSGNQSKQSFIDFCLAQSVIDTGVTPMVYDNILTLSTCTGNGHESRWVVQAVCRGEQPSQGAMPLEDATTLVEES